MAQPRCDHRYNYFYRCLSTPALGRRCRKCAAAAKEIQLNTAAFRSIAVTGRKISRSHSEYLAGGVLHKSDSASEDTSFDLANSAEHFMDAAVPLGRRRLVAFAKNASGALVALGAIYGGWRLYVRFIQDKPFELYLYFLVFLMYPWVAIVAVAAIAERRSAIGQEKLQRMALEERRERGVRTPSSLTTTARYIHGGQGDPKVSESSQEAVEVATIRLTDWNPWIRSLARNPKNIDQLRGRIVDDGETAETISEYEKGAWRERFRRDYGAEIGDGRPYSGDGRAGRKPSRAEQADLAEFVRIGTAEPDAKLAAIERIDDKRILGLLCRVAPEESQRKAAADRLRGRAELKDVAENASDAVPRIVAMETLGNRLLLRGLFEKDLDEDVRCAAGAMYVRILARDRKADFAELNWIINIESRESRITEDRDAVLAVIDRSKGNETMARAALSFDRGSYPILDHRANLLVPEKTAAIEAIRLRAVSRIKGRGAMRELRRNLVAHFGTISPELAELIDSRTTKRS